MIFNNRKQNLCYGVNVRMTNIELNSFIKHYLEKDKSKSAIMLTGDWGIGKSYYIQNELVPFLQKNENIKCVIVSLYGLKTISEISKSIYLDLRFKKLQAKSEALTSVILAGKTIAKGIISYHGINLETSEKDMQQLYESIDLSGKLIILEDLERSQIDVLEILSYVNSLVEQDGIKVLLVANESEILKYEENKVESNEEVDNPFLKKDSSLKSKIFTKDSIQYLKVKEKTISDTIPFEGNLQSSILQIIKMYNKSLLSKFANEESAEAISEIMDSFHNSNLRSFIFACQKTADIFEQIKEDCDPDFIQCVFFGIISFSLRLKTGKDTRWDGGEIYSTGLGSPKYPLFKFCYNYIKYQIIHTDKIEYAKKEFANIRLYDKHKTQNDTDLLKIFYYYNYFEEEVKKAVQSISERLQKPEDISFYDYGAIAKKLIIIKNILGIDIQNAKQRLIHNLEGRGNELLFEDLFPREFDQDEFLQNISLQEEYKQLQKAMELSLNANSEIIPEFDYLPEQTDKFCRYVKDNYDLFYTKRKFAKNLDIRRFTTMFSQCTPNQKQDIRLAFARIYDIAGIKQFFEDDISAIETLKKYIAADIEQQSDKIQKLQYNWFLKDLEDIQQKLLYG